MASKPTREELEQRIKKLEHQVVAHQIAESVLRESEEKHRRLFETLSQGVIYQARDGAIISANPAAEKILGLSLDQMLGKTSMDPRWRMIHEDGSPVPGTEHPAMIALRTGQKVGPVTRGIFHSEKNAHIWLSITTIPLFRPGESSPFEVYATFDDITEYRRADENYRMLFREMLNGFALHEIICDATGHPVDYRFLAVNPAFERITGLNGREIVGRTVCEVLPITEPYWIETYGHVALTGKPVFFENYSGALDKHFEVTAFRTGYRQFACIFTDITGQQHAQLELRTIEKQRRTILETAMDGFWLVDLQGRLLEVNDTYCQMSGYSREELLAMSVSDLEALETPSETALHMQTVLTQGEDRFETRHRRKNGSTFEVEISVQYHPENGDQLVAFFRDITEKKAREAHLRLQALVLDQIQDLVTVTDLEGVITYMNQAQVDHLGQPKEAFLGHSIGTYGEGQGGPSQMDITENTVRDGSWRGEVVRLAAGGMKRTMDLRTQVVYADEGVPIALCGIATDITDQKASEAALVELMERFEKVFLSQRDAILLLNAQKPPLILECNPAAVRIFGYSREEMLGQTTEFLYSDRNALVDFENRLYPSIEKKGYFYAEDVPMRHKDGTLFPTETTVVPLQGNQGDRIGWVRISRDITKEKRDEEERERLQAQLLQAQKMESVGRLAGGVAHDFNNMLGVILGHAEMAMQEVDPFHPLHHPLEQIQKTAERSSDLVRQLLAFARKQIISPAVLDLNDTVPGMLKMLMRLIGEDIELVWMPGANLWSVQMDPSQVDQILANLCVNARDAIEGVGRITIQTENTVLGEEDRVGREEVLAPGDYVVLAVSDDGCGMEEAILKNIFEPFFTTKEVGKGTGLGLATVYGIVKQNNGFIHVYSEHGKGTTFRIYLSRHAEEEMPAKQETGSLPFQGGDETILLVEDEPMLLEMGKSMLEKFGYRVLAAGSPSEALESAGKHQGPIHLLMTDVIMPMMNGRDLARRLLAHNPGLKCLFMSGYPADVIAQQGVLDPGVDFIQKPFSMKDVVAKVREVLDSRKS